jgi:hypothetical protein
MYIDLIILVLIIGVVFFFFRKFSSVLYAIFIFDLVLRGLTYIKEIIHLKDLQSVIDKYIPESIPNIIDKYSSGVFYTILMWVYIILLFVFVGYLVRTFIKKRR